MTDLSHQFVPINALYLPDFFNEEPVKQEQAPSETAPLTEHDTNLWLFEEDDECFQKALHALNEFSDAMADATDNEFDASSSSTSTYSSITDNNDGGMASSARTCGRKRSSETMDKLRAADEQCRVSAEISRQAAEIGHKVIFEGVEHTSSLMESEIASKRFRGEGNSDCGGNSYCLSLGKVPTLLAGSLSNKRCEEPNCFKFPQGSTRFCISHGGGRRCTYKDCSKGARDRFFCATHGGGRRCVADFCSKSAVGGSQLCASHGGGRKCTFDGCGKSAQSPTPFCVMHGGGKKCQMVGCTKVSRGKTQFCASHGGGVRCATLNCGRAAISKHKFCRAHLTEDSSAENF